MAKADLDINESTLVFKYPDLYYLDLSLSYKVNQDRGSAKFDKTRKVLTVTLPVIGLTDEQREEFEKHNRIKE